MLTKFKKTKNTLAKLIEAQMLCAQHIQDLTQAFGHEVVSRQACVDRLKEVEEDLARLKRVPHITPTLQETIATLEADRQLLHEVLDHDNHRQRVQETEETIAKLTDLKNFLAEQIAEEQAKEQGR